MRNSTAMGQDIKMDNEHGVDTYYFAGKLRLIAACIDNYTPQELARELARLANTSHYTAFMDESTRIARQQIKDRVAKVKS